MAVMAVATLVFQLLPLLSSGLIVSNKQAPIPAQQPTLPPVAPLPPLGGVYCRGAGCRYRQAPPMAGPPPPMPLPLAGAPMAAPGAPGAAPAMSDAMAANAAAAGAQAAAEWNAKQAMSMGMDVLLAQKEFCRGTGCITGMGKPSDRSIAIFNAQCSHFFEISGLGGSDSHRTISHVREAFYLGCKPKVGNAESVFCSAYADAWVGALYMTKPGESVGSVSNVCTKMNVLIAETRQAELDLSLWEPAIPDEEATGIFSGSKGNRGIAWKKYIAAQDTTLLWFEPWAEVVPNRTEPVEITQGSFDGLVDPVKVSAKTFGHCESQVDEILMHQRATAGTVTKMFEDWCNWQSLERGKFGRPEWSPESCARVSRLVAFALRNVPEPPPPFMPQEVTFGMPPAPIFGQPSPTMPPGFNMMPAAELMAPQPPGTKGLIHPTLSPEETKRLTTTERFMLNPSQVCQQLFVAAGAIHRTERLLKNSFSQGVRKSQFAGPVPPTKEDPGLIALYEAAKHRLQVLNADKAEGDVLKKKLAQIKNFADFVPTPGPDPPDNDPALPDSSAFAPQVKNIKA
eukprot:TRINITY_DN111035_c0_g1_i1.p1 TRINITY_DN111035_c0_g1~~TRINITY_DN111035_c0_g1_i1.p1  ORF type:complete len:608 (+),score=138.98 TRINITY_DN111035_c0_g1_i1:120-1826(+)